MAEINVTDVYELQLMTIELMNANIEFWLGTTFAVLVAFHFMSEKINRDIYIAASTIYGLSAIFFGIRYLNNVAIMRGFSSMLAEQGYDQLPSEFRLAVGFGVIALFVIGTTGCLWYMWSCYRKGI